ncbi:MAG: hypothetical protein ACRDT2_02960, partial [Natronosporangium sp.]
AVVALAICTIGLGPVGALVTEIVVGAVPPERAGSAASMSETSGEFGIATGIAVLGSLGTAVYRSQVTVPADVPAELGTATRDTLASAAAAAEQLPAGIATGLLEPAREAFITGLNVVAGVGTVALAGFAVAAIILLRRTGTSDAAPTADPDADSSESSEPAPAVEPAAPATQAEPPFDLVGPADRGGAGELVAAGDSR